VAKKIQRFWEIDLLRGIAIIMMIIYHIIYDLNYFSIVKIEMKSPLILTFLYPIGTLFLLLVGISLTLSYSRVKERLSKKELWIKFLLRGLKIFSLGLVITVVSWWFIPEGVIVFGILHCIGICIILAFPFLQLQRKNFPIGIVLIGIGVYLRTLTFNFYWFFWLGFIPAGFFTIDYFPLLPWFGVVLVGIFVGNMLYPNYERSFKLKDLSNFLPVRFLGSLGRHSLVIYLVHQPVILGLIYSFFRF
jgi:uncharacterized membrane protein